MRNKRTRLPFRVFFMLLIVAATGVSSQGQEDQGALVVQSGHSGTTRLVAISNDSHYIGTAADDNSVKVWQAKTGLLLWTFPTETNYSGRLLFSPDGMKLAALGFVERTEGTAQQSPAIGKTLQTWDLASGKSSLAPFPGDQNFAFRNDGHILTVSRNEGDTHAKLVDFDPATEKSTTVFEFSGQVENFWFSPDAKRIAILNPPTLQGDCVEVREIPTNKFVCRLEGSLLTTQIAFRLDGETIVGLRPKSIPIWDARTGKLLHGGATQDSTSSGRLSPDGGMCALGVEDAYVSILRTADHANVMAPEVDHGLSALAIAPDNSFAVMADQSALRRCDLTSRRDLEPLRGYVPWVTKTLFSPDGSQLAVMGNDAKVRLWDIPRSRVGLTTSVGTPSTNDGDRDISFTREGELHMAGAGLSQFWSPRAGLHKIPLSIGPSGKPQSPVALSPDGNLVLQGLGLFDAKSSQPRRELTSPLRFPKFRAWVTTIAAPETEKEPWNLKLDHVIFSPNGKKIGGIGTADFYDRQKSYRRQPFVALWDVASGGIISLDFKSAGGKDQSCIAFSPAGDTFATGDRAGFRQVIFGRGTKNNNADIHIWNARSGAHLFALNGHTGDITSLLFANGGKELFSSARDGKVLQWSVIQGSKAKVFASGTFPVLCMDMRPGGQMLVTGNQDGSVHIWDVQTRESLVTLAVMLNGDWAVINEQQKRFDSNNLELLRGLHWRMSETPAHPEGKKTVWPLSTIMQQYYEPELLQASLRHTQFPNLPLPETLDLVQPSVKIVDLRQEQNDEVSGTVVAGYEDGKQRPIRDLKLFRDGQLVGYWPDPWQEKQDITISHTLSGNSQQLSSAGSTAPLAGAKVIRLPFRIRLSRRIDQGKVDLTAYAFNRSRVKSETTLGTINFKYSPEKWHDPNWRRGNVYVIGMGVNASQDPAYDLDFAVDDVLSLQQNLGASLRNLSKQPSSLFKRVFSVSLLSGRAAANEHPVTQPDSITLPAYKKSLRAVLELLTDTKRRPQLLAQFPPRDRAILSQFSPATPDDMVILYFSCHGGRGENGKFFLLPYDIGTHADHVVREDFVDRCINAEDLKTWLAGIDAGDISMVIDACHSAASFKIPGSRPGPLGETGLQQTAYDKGIRILAASRSEQEALELPGLGQGLLSYALIHDGLHNLAADEAPQDQRLTLDEWLDYGIRRVPVLYSDLRAGRRKMYIGRHAGRGVVIQLPQLLRTIQPQTPELFNYRKNADDVVIATFASRTPALRTPN